MERIDAYMKRSMIMHEKYLAEKESEAQSQEKEKSMKNSRKSPKAKFNVSEFHSKAEEQKGH